MSIEKSREKLQWCEPKNRSHLFQNQEEHRVEKL